MSLMNSIQQYPMQFLQPQFSPALTANPEIAKAAQYGGGGAAGGAVPATGGAPAAGGPAPVGGASATPGTDGIMNLIKKLLGGSSGVDPAMVMSLMG